MTSLDIRAIVALRKVRGMSTNAGRIADTLLIAARERRPITIRQRHALYAICFRFRRQIPMPLTVKVTIALAEAKTAAEEFRLNQPPEEKIRAFRVIEGGELPAAKRNPLDDLFPETVAAK